MSGVQGPLETRAKTTVETAAALQGLDATPWDSGELAFVRATGATYELIREDTTSTVDGFDFLAVAPPGSVGRWKRVCLSCTGSTGGTAGPDTLFASAKIDGTSVVPTILATSGEIIAVTRDIGRPSGAYILTFASPLPTNYGVAIEVQFGPQDIIVNVGTAYEPIDATSLEVFLVDASNSLVDKIFDILVYQIS